MEAGPPPTPSRDGDAHRRRSMVARRRSFERDAEKNRVGAESTAEIEATAPLASLSISTEQAAPSADESGPVGSDTARTIATATPVALSVTTGMIAPGMDTSDNLESPPPPELPRRRSLADFLEVHHGVNHAAEYNVSLNDAFAALEYTSVKVVNNGVLIPSTPKYSAHASV